MMTPLLWTPHHYVQLFVRLLPDTPNISLSSYCNTSSEGVISCICEVHGSPVPKLKWHLSGQPVPSSLNPSIREESVGSMGLRSFLSMHYSLKDMPSLHCVRASGLSSRMLNPVADQYSESFLCIPCA
ncbi:hypothetical protein NFI96_010325 [Prochilodus magdalenae]|nr:hypothetical protein NFI96_010325 [Prochilodus magdalenae]